MRPSKLQKYEYVLKCESYFFLVSGARELKTRVRASFWSALMVGFRCTLEHFLVLV